MYSWQAAKKEPCPLQADRKGGAGNTPGDMLT